MTIQEIRAELRKFMALFLLLSIRQALRHGAVARWATEAEHSKARLETAVSTIESSLCQDRGDKKEDCSAFILHRHLTS